MRGHLWPYLNYHRPCFFPVIEIDDKGRQRKRYLYENLMTPYEKFKSLHEPEQYLKPDVRLQDLEHLANRMSDSEAARRLGHAQDQLFRSLNRRSKVA